MASRSSAPTRTAADPIAVPPDEPRGQALQRLQVGLALLLGIVLVVALVSVVEERAKRVDDAAVPAAAGSVAAPEPQTGSDPLADAGVVPDLPPETPAAAEPSAAVAAPPAASQAAANPPAQ